MSLLNRLSLAMQKFRSTGGGKPKSKEPSMSQHEKTTMRRLSDHANACIHAYRQKGMQVLNGKVHKSLAGIPAEWK